MNLTTANGVKITGDLGNNILGADFELSFYGSIYGATFEPLDLSKAKTAEEFLQELRKLGAARILNKLYGTFIIVLFDKTAGKLYLMQDKIGSKPLYYAYGGGEFAFALRADLLPENFLKNANQDVLIKFVSFGFYPFGTCYFDGVKKLYGGMYLEFCKKLEAPKIYYASVQDAKNYNLKEALEEARRLLDLCLPAPKEDIGVFLSGGVDSSALAAIAAKKTSKLKTFTVAFKERAYNEAPFAAQTSKYLQTEHFEFIFSAKDVLALMQDFGKAYYEPFGDTSSLAFMLLCKETAKHVKVALGGDGADELFFGYKRYQFTRRAYRILRPIPSALRSLLGLAFEYSNVQRLKKAAFFVKNPSLENIYASVFGALKPWDLSKVFSADFLQGRRLGFYELLGERAPLDPRNIEQSLNALDKRHYLTGDVFVKSFGASYYYGLDAVAPFLDSRFVEFANSLPFYLRANKFLLRELLKGLIPQDLTARPKRGFSVPLGAWFRNELKELLSERIGSLDERFNKKGIWKMFEDHMRARANYEYIFWNLLQIK